MFIKDNTINKQQKVVKGKTTKSWGEVGRDVSRGWTSTIILLF